MQWTQVRNASRSGPALPLPLGGSPSSLDVFLLTFQPCGQLTQTTHNVDLTHEKYPVGGGKKLRSVRSPHLAVRSALRWLLFVSYFTTTCVRSKFLETSRIPLRKRCYTKIALSFMVTKYRTNGQKKCYRVATGTKNNAMRMSGFWLLVPLI